MAPPQPAAPPPAFQLESPAFPEGGAIPLEHTAAGADHSPPLRWRGTPPGTQSFALVLDDPDAPPGLWIHWVLFNIPGTATGLPANLPRTSTLADGSGQGRCWGVSSFTRQGYHGPQPPPGPPHRYRFTLTALNCRLPLGGDATAADLRHAMAGHELAEARLTGLHGRA